MSCLGCNLVINFHQVLYLYLVYCTFWKHKCTSFICEANKLAENMFWSWRFSGFFTEKPNTKAIFVLDFVCTEEDSYFSFLPLAHIYDQIMESYCIYKGSSMGFWRGDVRFLLDDIQELKPTMFCLRGFVLLKAVHLEPNPFDIERDLMTPNFQTEKTAITQILQGMISTWIRKGWNFDKLILNMYVELYHLQERVDKLYNEAKGGKV
ncbi:putative long-chain-fatty-acid--CoA ligase [Rosa chinensis]|uniref:Putative long-chain-fatty-acid--CoA ligase n=1 Tax=Rosa chinensis TaxID=74649 RepID=A0A2P6PNQ1_ROSCH|nr:putative long-chain-fatty-acid--CoA ligase [Rosa chinensis]